MPPPPAEPAVQGGIEFAPPPANAVLEPAQPEPAPAPTESAAPQRTETPAKPAQAPKPAEAPKSPTSSAAKPPVPAPREASSPAAAVYTVQVGVFADKANAERLQSRMTDLGFKPYTEQAGDSTRVRVGSFSDRAEADALLARLSLAGITGGKVVEK